MTNKERNAAIIRIFQEYAETAAKCIEVGGFIGPMVHDGYYAVALGSLRNVLMIKPKQDDDGYKVHNITIESTMTEDERNKAYLDAFIRAATDAGFTLEKA